MLEALNNRSSIFWTFLIGALLTGCSSPPQERAEGLDRLR